MAARNIDIFLIGKSQIDREEIRKWLDSMGADQYQIPSPESATDGATLISLAGRRCYKSFQPGLNPNVTKIREDMAGYLENILRSGHGSVLEHATFTFAIEGVSRVFTAEMNRHRAGWAISEGSLRYIRFDQDIPWWLPDSLRENSDDNAELAERKRKTVELFTEAFTAQEETYGKLLALWEMDEGHHDFHYKKVVTSALRRIVGMGVSTGGVWTGNVRALRHVFGMRCDPAAEEEIFHVFMRVAAMMREAEPMLFGDFGPGEHGGLKPRYWKV
jgi:thymidylate synthase (FAD)